MSGNTVRASIDELMQACDKIEAEHYGCEVCPLNGAECLQYACVEDIWNTVSERRLQKFLDVADNIESHIEEYQEQKESEEAEEQREYDEWIAELNKGYFRDRGI